MRACLTRSTLTIRPQEAISARILSFLASYIGSPRQMRNAYLDAMALARYYGSPDYFITFTCNPRWQEIQAELEAGQAARDRPDLVDRVFQI